MRAACLVPRPTSSQEERSEHHERRFRVCCGGGARVGQGAAPSPAERGAASDRRRARGARANRAHRRATFEPRGVRPTAQGGSDRSARVAGEVARPGARADPVRPDAGVAVRVLPGSGAADGCRPGVDAELGLARAAVRGCPSLELRRLRVTGAPPGVRPERLRRDAGGPVGVGREAAGSEPRRGRSRERLLRQEPKGDHPRHRHGIPDGDARVRRDDEHRRLVCAASRSRS